MKMWLQRFWDWLYFAKGGLPYASFERRMFANMIDTLLLMLLVMPIITPFVKVAQPAVQQILSLTAQVQQGVLTQQEYNMQVVQYIMDQGGRLLLIDFGYQMICMGIVILLFWFYRSATPGKMIFNMEIVDAKNGLKPTRKQWLIRYLGYVVAAAPLMLGFVWIFFDKKRQGWHDKLAGTLVIVKPKKDPQ